MNSLDDSYTRNELFQEPSLEPLTVRFYEDTATAITEISATYGLSKAEVVRRLVVYGLDRMESGREEVETDG
ncbi:MAG: hypothetical protein SVW02_04290 [Candidatus Nanohaloarchaea archaeon]|nr:hypothetical protein [Candidatus Nanohaloarchaea archaeon]